MTANLPGSCWMDEDGRHVWWQHDCVDATGKRVEPPGDWTPRRTRAELDGSIDSTAKPIS